MDRRIPALSIGTISAAFLLVTAAPIALATTSNHPVLTTAQKITRLESRLSRLEHRETVLRSKGKTKLLAKVEGRVTKLEVHLNKLKGR
ncbi:hypothetical protein ACSSZE_13515 [Acidithiobacillus caldus]